MTTIVVVRKGDSVAIAADSLTTFGNTKLVAQHDRTFDRIVRHRDTYIGLCGSAAHQLVFESLLAKHASLDFSHKSAIFETFRQRRQRLAFLRTFQAGKRAALSQKLLNEVSAAGVALLNAAKKRQYDDELCRQLEPRPPAAVSSPALAPPLPVARPITPPIAPIAPVPIAPLTAPQTHATPEIVPFVTPPARTRAPVPHASESEPTFRFPP